MAVGPLRALVEAGHEVVLVVSQPDRRRGRGGALVPSPVKAAAVELGLPVSDKVDDVIDSGAELGVVVAFGRLIKPHVLDAVPMVNLHFSLLPRWRGAAPVEWSILSGDTVTGAAVMALEAGLDTGPVYAVEETDIGPDEIRRRAAGPAGRDRDRPIGATPGRRPAPSPRPRRVRPPTPASWNPRTITSTGPSPPRSSTGSSASARHGRRSAASACGSSAPTSPKATSAPGAVDPGTLRVGTGGGALELIEVQPEGRGPQPAPAWRNGARLQPGDRLGA